MLEKKEKRSRKLKELSFDQYNDRNFVLMFKLPAYMQFNAFLIYDALGRQEFFDNLVKMYLRRDKDLMKCIDKIRHKVKVKRRIRNTISRINKQADDILKVLYPEKYTEQSEVDSIYNIVQEMLPKKVK